MLLLTILENKLAVPHFGGWRLSASVQKHKTVIPCDISPDIFLFFFLGAEKANCGTGGADQTNAAGKRAELSHMFRNKTTALI